MPTLEANKVRLALDKSSKLRLLDAATADRIEIPQGAGVDIECAVFDGPVLEENLITDFDDVLSVQLIIRAVSPNGAVLLEQSVAIGSIDSDIFFSDWLEEHGQQFTFSFDASETSITLPASGKLPIYFVVRAITADNEYNLGFGYGEIVDIGIVSLASIVTPPFTSVYVNAIGDVQNIGPINYVVGQLEIGGVPVSMTAFVPTTRTVNGHALSTNVVITPTDLGLVIGTNVQAFDADLSAIAALVGTSGLLKKTAANTWSLDTSTYATQAYADALVVGLLDDRGNFSASGNVFPSSGGSGSAGAILKGDLWTISVAGTLGGHPVTVGDVIRALADTPGQTDSNWAISENNFGYVALNQALADGKIYVGNVSGVGTAVTPSGDVTMTNAGVTVIGATKVTSAMLNTDVYSTAHTWAGIQTFSAGAKAASLTSTAATYNQPQFFQFVAGDPNWGFGVRNAGSNYHVIATFAGAADGLRGFAVYNSASLGDVFRTTDQYTFSFNSIGIGTSVFGASGISVLGIANGTEPTTSPIDMVQLYSVDLSAGNATLGLRTETPLVTESVVSDRTLSIRHNGVTIKLCCKA